MPGPLAAEDVLRALASSRPVALGGCAPTGPGYMAGYAAAWAAMQRIAQAWRDGELEGVGPDAGGGIVGIVALPPSHGLPGPPP